MVFCPVWSKLGSTPLCLPHQVPSLPSEQILKNKSFFSSLFHLVCSTWIQRYIIFYWQPLSRGKKFRWLFTNLLWYWIFWVPVATHGHTPSEWQKEPFAEKKLNGKKRGKHDDTCEAFGSLSAGSHTSTNHSSYIPSLVFLLRHADYDAIHDSPPSVPVKCVPLGPGASR